MSRRKTPRLAYCEYVIPDPKRSTAVWMARLNVMRAVKSVYPIMLRRLLSDVFPSYKALAESGFDADEILWNDRISPFTELVEVNPTLIDLQSKIRNAKPAPPEAVDNPIPSDDQVAKAVEDDDFREYSRLMNERATAAYRRRQPPPKIDPATVLVKCAALRDALKDWGIAFNAEVLWFLDETLRTLRGWHVAADWHDSLRWNPVGSVGSQLAVGERFQFDCEGWEMQLLTWSAYSKSVRERFEEKLAEYEATGRKLAESRGLVRAPHKYSPSNFDWFVLYQFAGQSSTQIVERLADQGQNVDESTVLKGIKAAAKLAGWDHLRPAPRRNYGKIR